MNLAVDIITILSIIICFVYTTTIALFCYGWVKTKTPLNNNIQEHVFVSIIIPVRNELYNVGFILESLTKQNYSKQHYEIIIVDDNSTDDTYDIAADHIQNHKCLTLIKNNGEGKKSAIATGIKISKGELIITLDADSMLYENYLTSIVSFYNTTDAKMIVAPVSIFNGYRMFHQMQTLEFMALVASGAGSLYFNKAIMCNGANLIYTKEVFEEVNGFAGIDHTATGDDVLLMYKIKNKYPNGIKFLKDWDAIVQSSTQETIKEFINQRKRWASKKFSDLNTETKFVSLTVYLFSLFLILLPVVVIFSPTSNMFSIPIIFIWLVLFSIKCIIDFLLLFLSASFFEEKQALKYFLLEQIVYLFYVVLVGFMGFSRKYEWKERMINEK